MHRYIISQPAGPRSEILRVTDFCLVHTSYLLESSALSEEALWPSDQGVELVIRRSRVQIFLPATRWIYIQWPQIQLLHKLSRIQFLNLCLPSDSHTNTVISNCVAYPSRWRRKPWPILQDEILRCPYVLSACCEW